MSIIATAVKHLMAAGVTGDALVAAIADMEANMVCAVDPVAEKRRAYDRERKRNKVSGGIPVESAERAETTPFPAPPKDNNQTPPTHTPVNKTTRAKRLPVDWEPAPLPAPLFAQVSAWRCGLLESEMAKFRDWAASAPAKSGLKADWDATWRNWLRRKIEENPKNGQSGNKTDGMGRTGRAIERLKREISGGSLGSRTGNGSNAPLPTGPCAGFIEAEPDLVLSLGHDRR